jgi:hypothetical protein
VVCNAFFTVSSSAKAEHESKHNIRVGKTSFKRMTIAPVKWIFAAATVDYFGLNSTHA